MTDEAMTTETKTEWECFMPLRPVMTPSGAVCLRPAFRRRKSDGSWEYRAATPAEETDYVSREAW